MKLLVKEIHIDRDGYETVSFWEREWSWTDGCPECDCELVDFSPSGVSCTRCGHDFGERIV